MSKIILGCIGMIPERLDLSYVSVNHPLIGSFPKAEWLEPTLLFLSVHL
jgi:hypothetical protein